MHWCCPVVCDSEMVWPCEKGRVHFKNPVWSYTDKALGLETLCKWPTFEDLSKKLVLKVKFSLRPFTEHLPFQSSFTSLVAHTSEFMQHDAEFHTCWKKFSG